MNWFRFPDAQTWGLILLSVADVPNFLAGLLPSLFTIGTFAHDDSKKPLLERGKRIGTMLSLMVGVASSLVTRSVWPLVASAFTLHVLLREYKRAENADVGVKLDMRAGAEPAVAGSYRAR